MCLGGSGVVGGWDGGIGWGWGWGWGGRGMGVGVGWWGGMVGGGKVLIISVIERINYISNRESTCTPEPNYFASQN